MDEATRYALKARSGDPDAVGALVRMTQAEVWRFCAHLCDAGSADDLAQETYVRALRSLPSFRGTSTIRTWLLAIARRVVADELDRRVKQRKLHRRLTTTDVRDHAHPDHAHPDHAHPGHAHPDHAGEVGMRAIVDTLDPDRRAAFVLTQLIGLPYAEAAEILGCPVGTIRSRVARARADLVPLVTGREARGPKRTEA